MGIRPEAHQRWNQPGPPTEGLPLWPCEDSPGESGCQDAHQAGPTCVTQHVGTDQPVKRDIESKNGDDAKTGQQTSSVTSRRPEWQAKYYKCQYGSD